MAKGLHYEVKSKLGEQDADGAISVSIDVADYTVMQIRTMCGDLLAAVNAAEN